MNLREKIEITLKKLIRIEECVLTYDESLIDHLPDILGEQYGIFSDNEIENSQELKELFILLSQQLTEDWHIQELPSLIKKSGISLEPFHINNSYPYASMFERWSEQRADQNLDLVLALQKDLGMGKYSSNTKRHDPELKIPNLKYYLRSVISAPMSLQERIIEKFTGHQTLWEYYFSRWIKNKILSRDKPTLSIGPRWITEIRFFREVVGLNMHIGLDLFSDNHDLVIAGDMHQMPFENDHFNFIFLKNVVDKSYNVRRLVKEVIRIIEPGGIVAIDQICGYCKCNPLTRTDIQRAKNLLRLFQARCKTNILVLQDIDISGIGDSQGTDETRNNARLAFQVWER